MYNSEICLIRAYQQEDLYISYITFYEEDTNRIETTTVSIHNSEVIDIYLSKKGVKIDDDK